VPTRGTLSQLILRS